ncbi:Hypothetical protein DB32_008206 [Sandaracinus amylolyticus]|uniref:Uncharacterized protein n=1 Tax=Sandaracinus amylolyticus TaxID=927083 RepID=A0A0F6YN85_9BACT|nr:Hypothetical protein DB32_008206 [Sandaracinus amylolyticus]
MALWVVLAACDDDPSMLIVVVESDLGIPEPLDDVRAVVNGEGEHTFELTTEDPIDRVRVPFSFVVEPRGGDAARTVHLVVEGRRADGTVLVSREARTSFVPRSVRLLRVALSTRCLDVECPDGRTCIAGVCDPSSVDPSTLDEVTPGAEIPDAALDDGGAHDAGSTDAGTIDAGSTDAGSTDAGSTDGGTIDGGGRDGGTFPVACAALPAGSASGVYTIDPDGTGPIPAFEAYCDGGWTLLAKVTPEGDLEFEHAAWTSSAPMVMGTNDLAYADALTSAYWYLPVDTLRIALARTSGTTQWAVTALDGTSAAPLRDIVHAGTATFSTSAASLRTMLDVDATVPSVCDSGASAALRTFQVRLGVVAGRTSSCEQLHAWFGIGATRAMGCDTSESTIVAGSALLCGAPGQRGEDPRVGIVMGR